MAEFSMNHKDYFTIRKYTNELPLPGDLINNEVIFRSGLSVCVSFLVSSAVQLFTTKPPAKATAATTANISILSHLSGSTIFCIICFFLSGIFTLIYVKRYLSQSHKAKYAKKQLIDFLESISRKSICRYPIYLSSARYGSGNQFEDVISIVENYLTDKGLSLPEPSKIFHDHIKGTEKKLIVEYYTNYNGEFNSATVGDYEVLNIYTN